ncbi:SUMF1/EgtB/PvdO family nonheme iron enzyme [Polyangium sp. 6x1]|uniref:SUMF1/EgtB/PvdO family nonheme iron enzyme n=1 Tax=Polyangium sp. 6x1 TaxID=3042689 RepID=UPI0024822061|nr:SUMF1/EgtB/PvdO family nonheme iron enzyme [Polyangium sp. 6x1]MDI1446423.1 SUMF1/EgtB/PvdO family nonheme iron enzyme [Polyangium sp. 6x1]
MTLPLESFWKEKLDTTYQRTDFLFSLLPREAMLERPIALRHPFLFYLGHLPAFAWNQIGRGVLGAGHLDETFDVLFERGIDPKDAPSARRATHSNWPSIAAVLAYRDEARRAVRARIGEVLGRADDPLCENARILHLVLEHELMHQETLLYMFAECRPGLVPRPASIGPPASGAGHAAERVRISGGDAVIGAAWDEIPFGWDNEFGRTTLPVDSFSLGSLPVRNIDWRAFLRAKGDPPSLRPRSWIPSGARLLVKTVFGPVPFEVAEGWPVQVTGEQARHYCAHHGGRLPTEAELRLAAHMAPDGSRWPFPWDDTAPAPEHANFGFARFFPLPTGMHPSGASAWGVEELIGNGWEWTSTPFSPLPGFAPCARTYPGYSADFFDGEHDVVFGASWATDPKLVRPSFRNWYRRTYPYAFTSFRVAWDD